MKNPASKGIEALVKVASTVPLLKGKTFGVYSEDELVERVKGITAGGVICGVIYDGIRAKPDGGDSNKKGGSVDVQFTILINFRQSTVKTDDPKGSIIGALDELRTKLIGEDSPSITKWKFLIETAVNGKVGGLCYMQKWSFPTTLL